MWEEIHVSTPEAEEIVESHRLQVPGGWIVRTIVRTGNGAAVSQVFIAADAHEEWTLQGKEEKGIW
jgi:hypothetical protein